MSADIPDLSKRSPLAEAGGNGGPDGGAEDDRPPVLDDILARVKAIDDRLAEKDKKRPAAGPTRAAFGKLAKSVGAIGESTGETRKLVAQLVGTDPDYKGAIEAAAGLAAKLGSYRTDFGRWVEEDRRKQRRWKAGALAAAVPAALLLGVLVEQQFQIVPLHDPTGGWRGHIWEQYGRDIVDCAVEAMRTDVEVECPLVVRRP